MPQSYDSILFCEIIESIPGIQFLRQENENGIKANCYQGLTGKLVIIDITDDEIEASEGKPYLIKLGVEDLISAMFPEEKVSKNESQEDNPNSNG